MLSNANSSKVEKWRMKYSALITMLVCLYSVLISWGDNWVLTSILGLGVIVCGTIGISDWKKFFKG
ncbi:hypothetical protein A9C19_14350 [Bacillus weihaiensis]|uniref:Uncharacterized protein n=1 Tax=Bacillus weihaiensis TaxID=1547283 RepID=A0A1L3MTZ4_9BACI|nr:hypothetical protein A9C19_14350 [Bacillus weihaiensis]